MGFGYVIKSTVDMTHLHVRVPYANEDIRVLYVNECSMYVSVQIYTWASDILLSQRWT